MLGKKGDERFQRRDLIEIRAWEGLRGKEHVSGVLEDEPELAQGLSRQEEESEGGGAWQGRGEGWLSRRDRVCDCSHPDCNEKSLMGPKRV